MSLPMHLKLKIDILSSILYILTSLNIVKPKKWDVLKWRKVRLLQCFTLTELFWDNEAVKNAYLKVQDWRFL